MKKLTDTDMYRTQNSNHPMQFVLSLLESYKGEKTDEFQLFHMEFHHLLYQE